MEVVKEVGRFLTVFRKCATYRFSASSLSVRLNYKTPCVEFSAECRELILERGKICLHPLGRYCSAITSNNFLPPRGSWYYYPVVLLMATYIVTGYTCIYALPCLVSQHRLSVISSFFPDRIFLSALRWKFTFKVLYISLSAHLPAGYCLSKYVSMRFFVGTITDSTKYEYHHGDYTEECFDERLPVVG